MKQYLMYLRKSRLDTDYDEVSVEETLSRHRKILEDLCRTKRLHVVETLEEVVSGESLMARPKMMRLLELISTGMYAGVICMDIERLSRGSSMESGYIMQVLQANNCKIITPGKIYDLQNESDEQFTDMKFMFSRYELKTINKRLVRGRNQSASEGKFMGSMAPYGYRAYKLPGVKGNSLLIDPAEAEVVKMIYTLYGQQSLGYNAIAYRLNDMHIPARAGQWSQTSVVNILNNEVYLGKIRWRYEPVKRVVKDGMLAKKRIKNDDYELYDGLHDPIITQEQWDLVKKVQASKNHTPTHARKKLMNPFASILVCEKCGAVMKRNVPAKNQHTSPWYRCPSRGCDCKTVKCDLVEQEVLTAMKAWMAGYSVHLAEKDTVQENTYDTALALTRDRLAQLQLQQDNICEYLEKGIYTVEMFTKRNDVLAKEIRALQKQEKDIMQQQSLERSSQDQSAEILPATQQILESYPKLSVLEKNALWKIVMEKITIYRTPEGELSLHIYPKLPAHQ